MNLGKSLLRLRQEKGLTQQQVGNHTGLATSYISRIENGHIEPSLQTLAKIAKALGISMASIFQLGSSRIRASSHVCPVSSSGKCIGEQIRSHHGKVPNADGRSYSKEELRLLRMTEYVAVHGAKEVRQTLAVLLESLMNHSVRGSGASKRKATR